MTRAVVIGCGISGLTCAVRLRESGFSVRIVTKALPPETASAVAGAVWYPYRAYPQERVLRWAAASLRRFEQLATTPASGVAMIELREFFFSAAPDPWWRSAVPNFRRLAPQQLPEGFGDGYAIRVPMIESSKYLPYLMRGVPIDLREIRRIDELGEEADLIVNCTGLGARDLCKDAELFPIRGQVVRTSKDDISVGTVVHGEGARGVSYVIPRSEDCILGTTAEDHQWSIEVDEADTRDILERCMKIEPRLRGIEILGARAGLRPGRNQVRLEREGRVIHNYGHGGSGFTLSWGCADEVLALARDLLQVTSRPDRN